MSTTGDRLMRCFRAVFPTESEQTLAAASPDTVQYWDSHNHFMLIELVEEEFGVRIPDRIGGELLSFTDFKDFLKAQASG